MHQSRIVLVAARALATSLMRAPLPARRAGHDATRTGHSGGMDRPDHAWAAGRVVTVGCEGAAATGVVSMSSRSLVVHSKAVRNAASVSTLSWAGCLVISADTDAARWPSSRFLLERGQGGRDGPAVGVLDEGGLGPNVAHRGPDLPMS